jgi:hypothetical protein
VLLKGLFEMKRFVSVVLALVFVTESAALALDGNRAAYMGGTFAPYTTDKGAVEGKLDTTRPDVLTLTPDDKHFPMKLQIAYAQIQDLEYGQKAGRRVGAAIGTSVLLGPIGLVTLFSKKRKHYLTIGYKDAEGFTLAVVETRSGKKIEFQDDEARKAGRG